MGTTFRLKILHWSQKIKVPKSHFCIKQNMNVPIYKVKKSKNVFLISKTQLFANKRSKFFKKFSTTCRSKFVSFWNNVSTVGQEVWILFQAFSNKMLRILHNSFEKLQRANRRGHFIRRLYPKINYFVKNQGLRGLFRIFTF